MLQCLVQRGGVDEEALEEEEGYPEVVDVGGWCEECLWLFCCT